MAYYFKQAYHDPENIFLIACLALINMVITDEIVIIAKNSIGIIHSIDSLEI